MIKTVVSVGLPVDENMIIRKNTLIPEEIKGDEKRICIVTGYCCAFQCLFLSTT